MQNPVFVEAEVQALIHENSSENEVIINTDGSVVCHGHMRDQRRKATRYSKMLVVEVGCAGPKGADIAIKHC
jgi:hypothetical protein